MDTRFDYNPRIGDTVLVRSNNDEPYQIGKLVGYGGFSPDTTQEQFPMVDINGTIYICLGIIVVDPGLVGYEILNALTAKEQWNLLSSHYKRV